MEVKEMRINEDGTHTWFQSFESILTKEDYNKNKVNLENTVEKLKSLLLELDIRKILAKECSKLEFERGVKKDSLKNFDKYWEELEASKEERKKAEKTELKKYLDNFDEIKKKVLEMRKTETMREIKDYKDQLEGNKKNLEHYK